MKRNMLLAGAAVAVLAGAASARPAVTNGGFETGDFTGWSQFGNTDFTGVFGGGVERSGSFGAFFGPIGSTGGISQSTAVTAGDIVNVSFWLHNDGGEPSSFSVDFDGANLMTLTNAGPIGYAQYTFNGLVVANTGATLSFTTRHDPAFWYLDDVSVDVRGQVVPLPSAAGLGFAGLTLVGLRRRR